MAFLIDSQHDFHSLIFTTVTKLTIANSYNGSLSVLYEIVIDTIVNHKINVALDLVYLFIYLLFALQHTYNKIRTV